MPVVRGGSTCSGSYHPHYPFSLFHPPISRMSSSSLAPPVVLSLIIPVGCWLGNLEPSGLLGNRKTQGTGKFPAASPILFLLLRIPGLRSHSTQNMWLGGSVEGFFVSWIGMRKYVHIQKEHIKTLNVCFHYGTPRTHLALSWDVHIYLRSKTVSNRESN